MARPPSPRPRAPERGAAGRRFATLVSALTGKRGVTVGSAKRGFGSGTLQVNGRIFAMVAGDRIVLKLSAARVAELVAAGYGTWSTPANSRPIKECVPLPPNTPHSRS